MATARDELLRLEHEGWKSLCEGRGAGFYGEVMTDDGLMVLVNGMVLDRTQVVESLDAAPPWDDYEITEPRLVTVGSDAAALVYRASATRHGGDSLSALMTSVYEWVDGRPRLALYQQTTVTD